MLHFALDGIFVIFGNSENMTSGWMAPWRVYAEEDERYSRRSSLINSVQVLGAFVHGPLCFVAGWGIHRERNWYPIVAVLVSFCELYNRVILVSVSRRPRRLRTSGLLLCAPDQHFRLAEHQAGQPIVSAAPGTARLARA